MNAGDELARTEALLEELERLVATGALTGAQLERLEGVVLPPLFVRLRILRRAAGDWQTQATRQLEASARGWSRVAAELAERRIRPAELDTITALYSPSSTGWAFNDYGMGPALAEERRSRGFVLLLAVGAAFWLAKGRAR